MTSHPNPTSKLEEQIKSLPRPDPVTTKYLIEVELDDLVALITSQRQEAYDAGYAQGVTDEIVCVGNSGEHATIQAAKANLDYQLQLDKDTDVLIKPHTSSDTDVTTRVAGKEVKFSHTGANLDMHMFVRPQK